MNKIPVSYLQTDSRWASIDYSAPGESTTIGKSGCGPTCMAMVIASLKNPKITPKDTCAWSKAHGYKAKNQGTYYSYFTPQGTEYGIAVKRLNNASCYGNSAAEVHQTALNEIKKGNWIIACMGKGNWTSSGHFILWYDYTSSGNVLIRDPNSTASSRINAKHSVFKSQVKYYFSVTVPKESAHVPTNSTINKDEITMGIEEVKKLILQDTAFCEKVFNNVRTELAKKESSGWAVPEITEAVGKKITDGSRPGDLLTREEGIALVTRAINTVATGNREAEVLDKLTELIELLKNNHNN